MTDDKNTIDGDVLRERAERSVADEIIGYAQTRIASIEQGYSTRTRLEDDPASIAEVFYSEQQKTYQKIIETIRYHFKHRW